MFEDSEELKDVVKNIANRMRDFVRKLPRSLQLNGLKGLFQKFDTNHDGQISRSEFRAGLQSLNINLSDHRFRLICNAVDLDRRCVCARSRTLARDEIMNESLIGSMNG